MSGITAGTYLNGSLLFPFTRLIQNLRKESSGGGAGRALLGPIILFPGGRPPQGRNNRDRLNFIKLFISVCVNLPPWKYFVLFCYIYRQNYLISYINYNIFSDIFKWKIINDTMPDICVQKWSAIKRRTGLSHL